VSEQPDAPQEAPAVQRAVGGDPDVLDDAPARGTPPSTPQVAPVEPLMCGGAEFDGGTTLAAGSLGEPVEDGPEPTQRQADSAPATPPAPAPACPAPSHFTAFTGRAPTRTAFAAFVSTRLDLASGAIAARFQAAQSWVNRTRVPAPGTRAPDDARLVGSCRRAFAKPNTASFETTPDTTCPAAAGRNLVATSAAECETVIGTGLDADRQADANGRLLTHEQYHVRLACSLARIGNGLIASGTSANDALRRASRANATQQGRYDTDSAHGCNSSGQSKWQADIDADNLTI
jgi:hypothetical protein